MKNVKINVLAIIGIAMSFVSCSSNDNTDTTTANMATIEVPACL